MQSKDHIEQAVRRIHVSIPGQWLRLFVNEELSVDLPVSTSKYGIGTVPDSYCTPTGNFQIAEKIGHGAPLWSIFRGRRPTGELASEGGTEDLVLTRILWLDGLEVGNANTRERFIYIHGTNHESQIGLPASHGCVRLRNRDMVDLFDRVSEGDRVLIS